MVASQAPLRAVGAPTSAGSGGKRAYSDAFKRDAVEKARAAKSISQVARALGVSRPTLTKWMQEAEPPPMSLLDAVRSGNRKAFLIAARDDLAAAIAAGMAPRDRPPNMRLLNEYMRELDEIAARESEEAADAANAPDEEWDEDSI